MERHLSQWERSAAPAAGRGTASNSSLTSESVLRIVETIASKHAARRAWLFAIAGVVALAPAVVSAGQIVESGNLLVNPGAESWRTGPLGVDRVFSHR